MNQLRKEQYKKFLEEKDELIESLAADFAKAFEKAGPQSVWHVFTPVHEAAEKIRKGEYDKENTAEQDAEGTSILRENLTRLEMAIGDYDILEDRLGDSLDMILLPVTEDKDEYVNKAHRVEDSRGITLLADTINQFVERLCHINRKLEGVIHRIDL